MSVPNLETLKAHRKSLEKMIAMVDDLIGAVQSEQIVTEFPPSTIAAVMDQIKRKPGISKTELSHCCRKFTLLDPDVRRQLLDQLLQAGMIRVEKYYRTEKTTNPAIRYYVFDPKTDEMEY